MPERELSAEERDFLCSAYEQAKDHPQRQVIDDPLQSRFGASDLLRLRGILEGLGYLNRGGLDHGGLERGATGGFWLTRAGMNEAERICGQGPE